MSKPRISYIDPATIQDKAMVAEFDRCARQGTPRPESQDTSSPTVRTLAGGSISSSGLPIRSRTQAK